MRLEVENSVAGPIPHALMRAAAAAFQRRVRAARRQTVAVALVDRRTSRRLNRTCRGVDAPTDVLSFPGPRALLWPPDPRPLWGEIVICYPIAVQQAKMSGHGVRREVAELFVHGLAHLAGYGHHTAQAAARMAAFEARLLAPAAARRPGGRPERNNGPE